MYVGTHHVCEDVQMISQRTGQSWRNTQGSQTRRARLQSRRCQTQPGKTESQTRPSQHCLSRAACTTTTVHFYAFRQGCRVGMPCCPVMLPCHTPADATSRPPSLVKLLTCWTNCSDPSSDPPPMEHWMSCALWFLSTSAVMTNDIPRYAQCVPCKFDTQSHEVPWSAAKCPAPKIVQPKRGADLHGHLRKQCMTRNHIDDSLVKMRTLYPLYPATPTLLFVTAPSTPATLVP